MCHTHSLLPRERTRSTRSTSAFTPEILTRAGFFNARDETFHVEFEMRIGVENWVRPRDEIRCARRIVCNRFGARLFQRTEKLAIMILEFVTAEQCDEAVAKGALVVEILVDVIGEHFVSFVVNEPREYKIGPTLTAASKAMKKNLRNHRGKL